MKIFFAAFSVLAAAHHAKAAYCHGCVDLPVYEEFDGFADGDSFFLNLDGDDGDDVQQKDNAVKKKLACDNVQDQIFAEPTYCPDYHGDNPVAGCNSPVPYFSNDDPCDASVVRMKGDSFLVSEPVDTSYVDWIILYMEFHVQGVEDGDSFEIQISPDGYYWDDDDREWFTKAALVANGNEDRGNKFFVTTTEPIYVHNWGKMFFKLVNDGNQESDRFDIGKVVIREVHY